MAKKIKPKAKPKGIQGRNHNALVYPPKNHKAPCIYCGQNTAWHRPKKGSQAPNNPKDWIYVCYDCVATHKENSQMWHKPKAA